MDRWAPCVPGMPSTGWPPGLTTAVSIRSQPRSHAGRAPEWASVCALQGCGVDSTTLLVAPTLPGRKVSCGSQERAVGGVLCADSERSERQAPSSSEQGALSSEGQRELGGQRGGKDVSAGGRGGGTEGRCAGLCPEAPGVWRPRAWAGEEELPRRPWPQDTAPALRGARCRGRVWSGGGVRLGGPGGAAHSSRHHLPCSPQGGGPGRTSSQHRPPPAFPPWFLRGRVGRGEEQGHGRPCVTPARQLQTRCSGRARLEPRKRPEKE